ncbi:hypothetical protein GCM10027447_16350 [Glycomyces halotolerans]
MDNLPRPVDDSGRSGRRPERRIAGSNIARSLRAVAPERVSDARTALTSAGGDAISGPERPRSGLGGD